MRINVGSQNAQKVSAVKEMIGEYPHLREAEVRGLDVSSGVSSQPKSLEETVRGAMNRAEAAFGDCEYAFGLESGLFQVPGTKSGYMDVCVCAIFDGKEHHLGLSSAWEAPRHVTELMVRGGLDMNQAFKQAGYTDKDNLGNEEGAIGILTKGRLDRKAYTKECIRTALIHLEP